MQGNRSRSHPAQSCLYGSCPSHPTNGTKLSELFCAWPKAQRARVPMASHSLGVVTVVRRRECAHGLAGVARHCNARHVAAQAASCGPRSFLHNHIMPARPHAGGVHFDPPIQGATQTFKYIQRIPASTTCAGTSGHYHCEQHTLTACAPAHEVECTEPTGIVLGHTHIRSLRAVGVLARGGASLGRFRG